MGEGVTDWLPKEAFTDDAVKAALADLVAGWSDCWFARQPAAISAVRARDGRAPVPAAAECLHVRGVVASSELSEFGKWRLLEAALDVDFSTETPSADDQPVLDAFATQVAEDLIARLDRAFGRESAQTGGAHVQLILSVAGSDMLTVTFPDYAIVPMLKARLGGPKPGGVPRSRTVALAPTRLIAEGLLGRAELAVDDLKGLTVGDVLVLDRSLQEPVELRLSGGQHVGGGKLGRNGAHVSIQF